MANTFQRQSLHRKLAYGGLIIALFTGTLFYRPMVLESQARDLALRESDQGEVDLAGAAVNLTLTGSRGYALCVLWMLANEKQKRHEWNELRLIVSSITKLQPHFLSVWTFQSWNLAYNVSVVSDDLRDRYYWIAEGIKLGAEGERYNRDNPDMRFSVGFYYQDKIGVADQATTFRSLLQMSAMDPRDRDPKALRKPDGSVDLVKFKAFLEKHPHFVRRLVEPPSVLKTRDVVGALGLPGIQTPEDVVRFLEKNQDIPSIFETAAGGKPLNKLTRKPLADRFPVFPEPDEAQDYRPTDDVDNYGISKRWHVYAQEPLPPPYPTPWTVPHTTLEHGLREDDVKHRLPRRPATMIFRQYPARSQSFIAEKLQKEGWFAGGWEVDEGRLPQDRWFPSIEKVVVGQNETDSGKAWEEASAMWERHGEDTHLYLRSSVLDQKLYLAQKYREAFHPLGGAVGPPPPESADAELKLGWDAVRQLSWYEHTRTMTSFGHFLVQAEIEKKPQALAARRLFFEAERRRKAGESAKAIRLYEDPHALLAWRDLLIQFPDFRHDERCQEDAYTVQDQYLTLIHDQKGLLYRQLLTVGDVLGQAGLPASVLLPTVNQTPLPNPNQAQAKGVRIHLRGPFDDWAPRDARDAPRELAPTLVGAAAGGAFLVLGDYVAGNSEPLISSTVALRARARLAERQGQTAPQPAGSHPPPGGQKPPRPAKGNNE